MDNSLLNYENLVVKYQFDYENLVVKYQFDYENLALNYENLVVKSLEV
jgi:hypothetical protein